MLREIKLEIMHGIDKTTIRGTDMQEEVLSLEYEVRRAVIHMLAKQYVDKYGKEILEAISPDTVADELKKEVASRFWANNEN